VHPAEKFVPNYFRLESHLRESMRNGDLKPGNPIPPESQLCQQFSVSRTTVRQALSRLVYDGLIVRHRGRGSFVAEPRLEYTKALLTFEEEMRARGAAISYRVLDFGVTPADGKVAEALGIPEGTPVTILKRVRLVDGEAVGYEVRYLPRRIGDALTTEEVRAQALVPAVERVLGRPRTGQTVRITASAVRPEESRVLGVKAGLPVLIRENIWYLDPAGPIQFGKTIFRGDRYQMCLEYRSTPLSSAGE
jgi:GntR family transcriptional regulator